MSDDQIENLQDQIDDLQSAVDGATSGADIAWLMTSGTFVFFMQCGFAMLEAGSVRSKNTINILYKSLIDGAIAAVCYWILGYGFAYGDTENGFIGKNKFALTGHAFDLGDGTSQLEFQDFFFQWTFTAAAATIVSGCVAERCKIEAYFCYCAALSGFIYPVIVHWCWGDGWMSPFASQTDEYLFYGKDSNSFVDFAGSGVVHAVGGLTGLVAAIMLGPRKGRFVDGEVKPMPGHSVPLVLLGTLILWVGWYGFNPGSTLAVAGDAGYLAAKVAVVTTISAAFSGVTMALIQGLILKEFDLCSLANAILAGLVGVTGPCAVIEPWGAMCIGIASCFVYYGSAQMLLFLQIDDPLEASPIHGFCGIWGVLAVGIFGNDDNAAFAGYYGSANGNHPFRTGEQFGVQLVGMLAIIGWVVFMAILLFTAISFTVGLRVSDEVEEAGLDSSEHGASAYEMVDGKGNDQFKVTKVEEEEVVEKEVVEVDQA